MGTYECEWVDLTAEDFPLNAAQDAQVVRSAAEAICERCDVLLGIAFGEMVAWDLLGGGRCARVDDILAVYEGSYGLRGYELPGL